MSRYPQLDPEIVKAQIDSLSRQPFRDLLARFLVAAPTEEAIAQQAEKHPDRWAQSTVIVARLGGFSEKLEVEGSLSMRIEGLSDAQLQAELATMSVALDIQSSDLPSEHGLDAGASTPGL